MTRDPRTTNLTILVDAGVDALPEDLDALTRRLRDDIRDLGVESVDAKSGPAPAGTKSADALTLGALTVTLLPNILPRLIEFLQSWSLQGKDRTIKIKANVGDRMLDVEYPAGATDPAVQELIQQMTAAMGPAEKPKTRP